MKYLLDTCILLWVLSDDENLPKEFLKIIEEPANQLLVSVVSYWEIVIKKGLRKLDIADDWIDKMDETGLTWLHLEPKHIQQLEKLPLLHKDPFDRLLMSQAKSENIQFLTVDEKILMYQTI
jgi:PIN domain nuclease of toxin-antitoxin system